MINLVEDLYDTYSKKLRNYALSLSRDSDMADELVQETFSRAIQHCELLKILPEYKRRSWLFTVLKNCFIDIYNRKKLEVALDEDIEIEEVDHNLVCDTGIFLSDMPEDLKTIVIQKYWLGLNSSEIAKELSIPPGTVRYKLHLAINKIRNSLEKHENLQ
jgi:RNA polymerase sigma-70 factor (ECF subfamily)